MDFRKHVEECLAELDLRLDEDGSCLIEIDDERECVIVLPEDSEAVLFCVNVALVAELDRDGLYERFLIMNFMDDVTRGAALGLTPDGEVVAIRLTLTATVIGAGDIERIVANLAGLAEWLDQHLRGPGSTARRGEQAASGTELHAPSPDGPNMGTAKYA